MFPITAIILTKNEEKNIVDCLESLSWCDEIIVVDDKSEDRTTEIVKNLRNEKLRVFTRPLDGDFSSQRNFGLEKARREWVFFVDGDERVSESLKNEISYLISFSGRRKQLNGYFIKRIDFMWGKELKHGETGNIRVLRLAKKGTGRWEGKVHERWKVKANVGELKNPLVHYPHKTINNFLKEINFYTDLHALELFHKRTKVYWWSSVAYPLAKFFLNYFLRRGFLDGLPGFIFAIIMSLHSFLVRGKLWLLWSGGRRSGSFANKVSLSGTK